jgi:hypothetical protein
MLFIFFLFFIIYLLTKELVPLVLLSPHQWVTLCAVEQRGPLCGAARSALRCSAVRFAVQRGPLCGAALCGGLRCTALRRIAVHRKADRQRVLLRRGLRPNPGGAEGSGGKALCLLRRRYGTLASPRLGKAPAGRCRALWCLGIGFGHSHYTGSLALS